MFEVVAYRKSSGKTVRQAWGPMLLADSVRLIARLERAGWCWSRYLLSVERGVSIIRGF